MKWDVYKGKQWWKAALIAFGVVIGIVSLFYTETFLKELRAEEERKIVLWAKAVEAVFLSEDDSNLAFYSQIIQDNKTIPVILVNDTDEIIAHRNLDVPESNPERYLKRKLNDENQPVSFRGALWLRLARNAAERAGRGRDRGRGHHRGRVRPVRRRLAPSGRAFSRR